MRPRNYIRIHLQETDRRPVTVQFYLRKISWREFRFSLEEVTGPILFTSRAYATRSACKQAIRVIRQQAINDERYERLRNNHRQFGFDFKTGNATVMGSSEWYPDRDTCEDIIGRMKQTASHAQVVEEG